MAKRSSRGAGGTARASPRGERAGKAPVRRPESGAAVPGTLARNLEWLDSRTGFTVAAVLLIGLALTARLVTWDWIFGSGRVELVPADSHYYVRLARLHLAAGGPVPTDPFVGFPAGSENYWPPFHTLLVTLLAAARVEPEVGVAFVGPIATALWLTLIAGVGRHTVGPRATLVALFVLALTPIAVEAGKVGNADHNVHEPPIAALVVMLAVGAVRGSAPAALRAGIISGAARLFTTTGFVFPGLLAGFWLVSAAVARADERPGLTHRAALSGAGAVGTLLVAVAILGHPGRLDYEALTLFHPLLACALFGLAVALCGWLERRRRVAALGAACALAGVFVIPQLLRAAGHLARRDPLLAVVLESRPLAADPVLAILLFGPVLLALPFALAGAVGSTRPRRAPELVAAAAVTALLLVGAAAQSRLATLLGGAAAVLLPLGLGAAIARLSPTGVGWARGAAALALSVLLLILVPPPAPGTPARAAVIRPTLVWMRDNLPPASPDPWDYRVQPSYGVLAPFDYGHFITLYAERPALASTFSQTDAHVEANRVATEILADSDEERAYRRARELELAYVLAAPSALLGVDPGQDALLSRLLRRDPLGRFRPLHVSEERRAGGGRFATVFEVVEGAELVGSVAPGVVVQAALGDGYVRAATADPAGEFRVRVSRPGAYVVSAGDRSARVDITEEQVRSGAVVRVGAAGA
jgi:hypothetical protein